MKPFKVMTSISLFLLLLSPTSYAELTKTQEDNSLENNKSKVNIKFSKNYKKTDSTISIKDNYKRAIIVDVGDKTDTEELQKIGEEYCREIIAERRPNYFVKLLKGNNAKEKHSVNCKNVEGPVIKRESSSGQDAKSGFLRNIE